MIFYDYLCGTSGQTFIFTQSTQGGLSGVHDAHGLEVDIENRAHSIFEKTARNA